MVYLQQTVNKQLIKPLEKSYQVAVLFLIWGTHLFFTTSKFLVSFSYGKYLSASNLLIATWKRLEWFMKIRHFSASNSKVTFRAN